MSGLGPAACWLAHKRLESWSRMAKERVGAVRRASEKSEDKSLDKPCTPPPSLASGSCDSQNESNSSTEVVASYVSETKF
jgi:hypothetical protein